MRVYIIVTMICYLISAVLNLILFGAEKRKAKLLDGLVALAFAIWALILLITRS